MNELDAADSALLSLVQAIVRGDADGASKLLAASPTLAVASFKAGASRRGAKAYYLEEIGHYLYAGETALHAAAAAYRKERAQELIGLGADIRARNRRGAEPLHAAAVGMPGSRTWNPTAQAATVTYLVATGADPNAVDKGGVTPLHRAVRTRCAAAVKALLEGAPTPGARTATARHRCCSPQGIPAAAAAAHPRQRAQQAEIVRLLREYGATE